MSFGFAIAEDENSDRDESKGKQSANIGKVGEGANIEKSRRNPDDKAGYPRGEVRRQILTMDAAEDLWKETVAHAHESANQNDKAQTGDVESLQRIDHWGRIVEESFPANKPCKDDDHADVKDSANDERGDNAAREIALRALAFFGSCGDGIEADVGKENDRATSQDAGPAVR
jgi:hypothetical protein